MIIIAAVSMIKIKCFVHTSGTGVPVLLYLLCCLENVVLPSPGILVNSTLLSVGKILRWT